MINKINAEIANSITHGIALLIFFIASFFLLLKGIREGSSLLTFSLIIFTGSIILLYFFSTIYHMVHFGKIKRVLRCLDHIGIYFLIAGSYTPFLLWAIGGTLGWVFFYILWGLAILGMIYKCFFLGKYPLFSLLLYLLMGWSVLFIAKSFFISVPVDALFGVFVGGIFYTAGTYFFWKDEKHTYYHAFWHLFVLFGTISHFFAVWVLI